MDGCAKKVAIEILRHSGVDVYETPNGEVVVTNGDTTYAYVWPAFLGRRTLHELQRRFRVPIHHFFNPDLVLPPKGDPN